MKMLSNTYQLINTFFTSAINSGRNVAVLKIIPDFFFWLTIDVMRLSIKKLHLNGFVIRVFDYPWGVN